MLLYESVTARSHELPSFLACPLYGIARLLGIDAALDGTTIAIHSMRRVHNLGATWELLLDPVTWCFLLGGIALLYLIAAAGGQAGGRIGLLKLVASLAVPVILWLPVRSGLLIALLVHRALRTEYDAPLTPMSQFWSPWLHLVLLAGPVLLAMRFVRPRPARQPDYIIVSRAKLSRRVVSAALFCAALLLMTMAMLWDPSGPRKQGRILVDEYHSTWERTDRPYDTNWYGQESGYNYACIYDYCSRFYTMGRLTTPIDANALKDCDVLIAQGPDLPLRLRRDRAASSSSCEMAAACCSSASTRTSSRPGSISTMSPSGSASASATTACSTSTGCSASSTSLLSCRTRSFRACRRWISPSPAPSIRASASAGPPSDPPA